jgi:16S rRNA C967 or C1407 C5-methylase (RsmB/RsmF family)/NOL1/NOP2/fmu family ribosome biogenesis protein
LASYLPLEFISSLKNLEHFDPEAFLRVHESGEQLVSVHMNSEKPILQNGEWPISFIESPFEMAGKVPWAPDAYYLSSRPAFTLDPLFHAGTYYVQEASGMFVAFAFKQVTDLTQKLKVLDLCAAPGGKSTLIQSLISPDSLLVSNEVIKTRVPVLTQNLTKWGRANSIVSNNDPAHFKQVPDFFDIMLVDAPCSGSGLYRKDREAASSWSMDLVKLCGQRQRRILADAWDCLKEDGFLIYSTCSYSKEENEDILDILFNQYSCESIALTPDPAWNIVETISNQAGAFGYRFYPDKVSGEGFFLAVIQKKQPVDSLKSNKYSALYPSKCSHANKSNKNPARISKSAEQKIQQWMKTDALEYIPIGDCIHALAPGLANDLELLKNNLYLKKAGIRVGKAGENEWIPDHELALANFLKNDSPTIVISKSDALHFLRGEPFEADIQEKGWNMASYMGQRLGWVKLLDRRMNNYYPKSWRIRQESLF